MSPETLVAGVLGIDSNRITDETSNQNLSEWDSLGHIMLILELEQVYQVSFSPEEALALTSVAAIKRALSARGAQW